MNEHPDLTAYTLGELDAEHAEAMARWITENPEALQEAEAVHELAQHLHNTAPIAVARLHAHQRDAVLSGPQRVRQMVAAAARNKPRKSVLEPLFRGTLRLAAAAGFVVAGYVAGAHLTKQSSSSEVAKKPEQPAAKPSSDSSPLPKATTAPVKPFRAVEIAQANPSLPVQSPHAVVAAAAETSPPAAESPATVPAKAPSAPNTKVMAVAAQPSPPTEKAPAAKSPAPAPINRLLVGALVNTTRGNSSAIILRPSESRPPAPPTGPVAADVANERRNTKAEPLVSARQKQPELLIHSWKAEAVSCPWDETRRLVRLVVQIPGEQAAASPGLEYPLQVTFDAKYVRSYRSLGERTVPALAADAPAFHIAWYECVPNGSAFEGARPLGLVTLPNARFTTATTAPFDSSSLQIIDRGTSWTTARDDFLFESALVGFGLLLKGEKDCGTLNHALVLDLATRAAADERQGERAKFAKLVQDAQKAAGLSAH